MTVRPRVFNHLIKATLFLLLVIGWLPLLQAVDGTRFFAAALFWLALAGLARNLHALLFRPRISADFAGISVRCWRRVGLLTAFLPYLRPLDARIRWRDVNRLVAHTSWRGVPWKSLRIETPQGTHEIGWDVFSPLPSKLAEQLLDTPRTFQLARAA